MLICRDITLPSSLQRLVIIKNPYIFTEAYRIFPFFARLFPQATFRGRQGKYFDHFLHKEIVLEAKNDSLMLTWQVNHTTLHDPWEKKRERERKKQHLKVFRKISWKLNKTWARISCPWQESKECRRAWPSAAFWTRGLRFTKYAQTDELPIISGTKLLWGHWETVSGRLGMSAQLLCSKCY